MEFARLPEKVSILAVLVLYRQALAESSSWQILVSQVDEQLLALVEFRMLICDNGPFPAVPLPGELPPWAEYLAVHHNQGLAWAYSLGLKRAQAGKAEWLLTLDQDTTLPPDFLSRIASFAKEAGAIPGKPVAAIVPQLVSEGGPVLSPVVITFAGEHAVPQAFQGFLEKEVRAYNSAALLCVRALEKVGGYDRRFWLDYLDHAVFRSLYASGYKVWIRGDLQLRHNLSLHDDRGGMSEERFMSFAIAEAAFRDLHASRLTRTIYTARLFLRALRQKQRGDADHFLRTTWTIFRERVTVRRKARIERWEAGTVPMCSEPEIVIQLKGSSTGAQP